MVRVRFAPVGARNAPVYRIVATDSRKSRDGESLEILGTVNRRIKNSIIKLNKERILYWMSKGAQLSHSVHKLLAKESIVEAPKRNIQTKKHLPKKKAQERAAAQES